MAASTKLTQKNARRLLDLLGSWPRGNAFGEGSKPDSELPFGPIPKEATTELARIMETLHEDDPVRSLWRCIKPSSRIPGIWQHLHEDAQPNAIDEDARQSCDLWWVDDSTLEEMVQQLRMLLWDRLGVDLRLRKKEYE